MRSLAESTQRWQETQKQSPSLADLRQAVRHNDSDSPCISGCRSICWKAFLLGSGLSASNWSNVLLDARSEYSSLRSRLLRYIEHPEELATGTSDPLTDDDDSPWKSLRQDETLRAEILQDVQRLPDEPFYHQPRIQTMIVNLLFVYCKITPDVGGYRQGMHELLAPIVYVVEQDAIDPSDATSESSANQHMLQMLDAAFIEHDSFALFSRVMDKAKAFYAVSEGPSSSSTFASPSHYLPTSKSSIVGKSQYIHEVCLYKTDPELSDHLKSIEILPQIFIIRWIRLLFSREFPFDQMLVLWDTLFCVDPCLDLIDLICTAMLLRVRWQLLDADYSDALVLLLKYPSPQAPYEPHTFVEDALFLRDHLNTAGGASLIQKYTGKVPGTGEIVESRPSTPMSPNAAQRRRVGGVRSPLSPSRFGAQQGGGVEAFFQGAAKGVLERGEKLGINQAVRDAMVEIRRNVSEARTSMKTNRDVLSDPGGSTAMRAVAAMDKRNQQLAQTLEETVTALKELVASDLQPADKAREELEVATAKIQFVKIYLEDSALALPEDEPVREAIASPGTTAMPPKTSTTQITALSLNASPSAAPTKSLEPGALGENQYSAPAPSMSPPSAQEAKQPAPEDLQPDPLNSGSLKETQTQRPPAIPTRSTLAQSSFAWMLEPEKSGSMSAGAPPAFSKPSNSGHKRPTSNATRERTAFLFGDTSAAASDKDADGLFGMEPIHKPKC